ncbi:hypothetical protein B1790_06065 [Mycobacterium sp. AT1]|nr:hypothetical protein B1790_06065 [Mycobacterium sp. AT1]
MIAAPAVSRFVSQVVFDENYPTIAAEVQTLIGNGGEARRRARVITCRTDRGDLLAEVIETTSGWVVHYRDGNGDLNRNADSYMPFRRGGWALEPLTGDRGQLFEAVGRSGLYGLQGAYFIDRIAAGEIGFTVRKPDRLSRP